MANVALGLPTKCPLACLDQAGLGVRGALLGLGDASRILVSLGLLLGQALLFLELESFRFLLGAFGRLRLGLFLGARNFSLLVVLC